MNAWRWMFPHILTLLLISATSSAQEASEPLPPSDSSSLFDEAQALMDQGAYEQAIEAYRQLLIQLPVSAKAQKAAFRAAEC